MRKNSFINLVMFFVIAVFTLLTMTAGHAFSAWSPGPKPKALRVASYEVGGAMYIICAALGEGIYRRFDVRLRTLPVGTGTSRILNIRVGNTDFGITSDSLFASEGLYDYAMESWVPQPLRMLYQSNRKSAYALGTGAKSGIKTLADLKGKKLPWPVGSPFTQLFVKGALAFAGLTQKDVTLVEFRSMAAMYQSVIDGITDVAPLDTMSSSARKLEASPRGIHWIPFPIDDKAGWNRFKAVLPLVQPVNCQHGPALSADKPVWLPTIPFPQYVAYSDLSESKAYWIVKMIAESFDEYKDITPAMVWHDPKEAIKANSVLPYHPGAVRYFKEAGL